MKYSKTTKLTPQKQAFVTAMSKTDNATEAVRQAYPELRERELLKKAEGKDFPFIRVKANELLTNPNIQAQITKQKERIAAISSKAVDRIETIIDDGTETNQLKASQFIVEQALGRAVQQVQMNSSSVRLSIDLTSSIDDVPLLDSV